MYQRCPEARRRGANRPIFACAVVNDIESQNLSGRRLSVTDIDVSMGGDHCHRRHMMSAYRTRAQARSCVHYLPLTRPFFRIGRRPVGLRSVSRGGTRMRVVVARLCLSDVLACCVRLLECAFASLRSIGVESARRRVLLDFVAVLRSNFRA